jgi:arsenite-transporting ATPase
VLKEVEQSFAEMPIWRSAYRPCEPVGVQELAELAEETYRTDNPLDRPSGDGPMVVRRTQSGAMLTMALPFVVKDDVDLARHGDELVVTVGSYRRLLALPAALAKQSVVGARIEDGVLKIRFALPAEECL